MILRTASAILKAFNCLIDQGKGSARLSALQPRNRIQIENMHLISVLDFMFDIDGTLVDSNELHVDSWDRAFRRFGKQFPREQFRAVIGIGSDQYLSAFLKPATIPVAKYKLCMCVEL